MDVLVPTTRLTRDHVRFEFHQPYSTSIRLTVDGQTIPVEVVRPTWWYQVSPVVRPASTAPPFPRAEWTWNWEWPDGSRYQLVCPVDGVTSATPRIWLLKNGQAVANGFFRGPRFVSFLRSWGWQVEGDVIEMRTRLGCRPRTYLRDELCQTLAVCFRQRGRTRGVIRGRINSPRTPLIVGMLLSMLVDIPRSPP